MDDEIEFKRPVESKKMDRIVMNIYRDSIELIERIVENGFTKDFTYIHPKEWIIFISRIMVKIESVNEIHGKEKLDILLMLIIFISTEKVQINPSLIDFIVKEFVPEIVDSFIFATKNMHIVSSKLMKYLKKLYRNIRYWRTRKC